MSSWMDCARKVEPYVPGDQPKDEKMIKLNTNENPYPPSPEVKKALLSMDPVQFRKYPDPTVSMLRNSLAETYRLKPEQVFTGVGSDDVIGMAFLTFFASDRPVFFPDITYSFYKVWTGLFQIPYELKAVDDELKICAQDYFNPNGGIIIPNPNAPTGILMNTKQIEEIIEHNRDVVVIVDEAYIDFGGESVVPLIHKYDNLLVVQTFSKSRAAAGLRIGFAMGHPSLIKALSDVKYSYNSYTMSTPDILLGTAILKDEAYLKKTTAQIIQTREYAKKELEKLGFSFPDSKANFIFARHETCPAEELFQALKAAHIYVRYFPQPRIDQYLRITIGTDEEMNELFGFLKEYLRNR